MRDKKGRLVKDLKAGDFELAEDGTKQTIESFTVVARGSEADLEEPAEPAAPAAAAAAPAPAEAVPTDEVKDSPAVLALVFDRMAAGGRDLSRKAALTYLAARRDGDYVGVFSIDLALHTVQNFTADPDHIRTGIDIAATQAGTNYASPSAKTASLQTLQQNAQDGENAAMSTPVRRRRRQPGGTPGGTMAMAGGASAERDIARMEMGMLRSFEALERDQQGFATSNGLLAVVQGLARIPGRKTVVFFSEGMTIPDRVLKEFQAVIATANRANVAIYTMDAGGLRTHSPTEETRAELEAAATSALSRNGKEDENGIMMKDAERNEDLLRLNPQSGLGQLAEQTGRLPGARHERRAGQLPADRPGHALPLRARLHPHERQLRRPLPDGVGEAEAGRARRPLAARLPRPALPDHEPGPVHTRRRRSRCSTSAGRARGDLPAAQRRASCSRPRARR